MSPADNTAAHQSPIIEIATTFEKGVKGLEGTAKSLKVISGSEAFRRFDWLRKVPTFNNSGNLRGMVVNKNWRVIFEQSSEAAEVLGRVAVITSFAVNIAEQSTKIDEVFRSSDDKIMKGLQLSAIAGTAAERVLAGAVTGTVSAALLSMEGYCRVVGLFGGGGQTFSDSCVSFLKNADGKVQTTVKTVTDTTKQAEFIYWVTSKITFE